MAVFLSVRAFFKDESGLTVVEYVVGAGLMVVGLAGLFLAFSDTLIAEMNTIFQTD
ncbi:Flp family type IVb pilin [Vibrio aquaticus]|uniref:Flp family type IVb pilin n=1 Tax=Vibrio aquaticus TaxID=2496559 RepID=A0A3S0V2B5_9VIBR|nr:Flp family type IVb pilin [Vibrio aquaticus]RTZ15224.1 Flp family type IVb pilin [Vibrio aquaticus]